MSGWISWQPRRGAGRKRDNEVALLILESMNSTAFRPTIGGSNNSLDMRQTTFKAE